MTETELADDLRRLGVRRGDTLFIHASYKSLGPVEGGAAAVIGALQAAVGPEGLLMMPSFNLVEKDRRAATWDPATTPATTGYLSEYFRQLPGTLRSDHYSHSVAARGRDAAAMVGGHRDNVGFTSPWDRAPWGRTFGAHSPFVRAYEQGGKVLMIGVDYDSATFLHLVEVMLWHRRLAQNPESRYHYVNRPYLGEQWDRQGRLRRGKVGQADCRLFVIREFVDAMVEYVLAHPHECCKSWQD